MTGCRVGAKNTLVKNYLALAERLGVTVEPLRTVMAVEPVDPRRPGCGYRVTTEATGAWVRKDRHTVTAAQVVFAAGAWGTQRLLHRMRAQGRLPRLSPRLGELTRTNSEALGGAVTVRVPAGVDLTHGVAITSSFQLDAQTQVQNARYGKGSNAMGLLATLLVDGGGRVPRPLRFAAQGARHPGWLLRSLSVRRWSERSVIGLVMQSRDSSLTVSARRGPFGGIGLTSRQGSGVPNPTWIPAAHTAFRRLAVRLQERTGVPALPGGSLGEILDVPMTAHLLGGAVIGDSPAHGVIDPYHRVWGYPGLHVVDGSAVSANPGVNPALTITAQAERAMSLWPQRDGVDLRPHQGNSLKDGPVQDANVVAAAVDSRLAMECDVDVRISASAGGWPILVEAAAQSEGATSWLTVVELWPVDLQDPSTTAQINVIGNMALALVGEMSAERSLQPNTRRGG